MSAVEFARPASERRALSFGRSRADPCCLQLRRGVRRRHRAAASGIRILDLESTGRPNYNPRRSAVYGRDALHYHHPTHYLHAVAAATASSSVGQRLRILQGFPAQHTGLMRCIDCALRPATAAGPGVPGSVGFPLAVSAPNIGWFILLAMPLLLWLGVRRVRAAARNGDDAAAGTLAFMMATVVYLVLVATALNIGENQRYRFMAEPFLFILAAAARLPRPRAARDARTGRVSSAVRWPKAAARSAAYSNDPTSPLKADTSRVVEAVRSHITDTAHDEGLRPGTI
jgi:hypothetical protein